MSTADAPVPRTLFDKLWERHVVQDLGEGFALLHVDRHVLPDFNGSAFRRLADRGLPVRHPELTFATADHLTRPRVTCSSRRRFRSAP